MNNDIIELILNKDENITYEYYYDKSINEHIIAVEKILTPTYCPVCGTKMYSKGIRIRKVRHPILNNGKSILIHIKQRSWICTNIYCKHRMNDSFSFVERNKQTTNTTDLMILDAMRDINVTVTQVAKRFKVSDSHVHNIFDKYINIGRFPLSEVISIDEVYTNFDSDRKYALVIIDFIKNKPIDLVESRRNKATDEYFLSIDLEERSRVKYLVCDMYKPYLNYINKYFPNAKVIVDSFHVIQWIISKIDGYIRSLYRKHSEINKLNYEKILEKNPNAKFRISDEMYLLKKCKWLILSNSSNINYDSGYKYNYHFKLHLDTYSLEKKFFAIDSNLSIIRDLKEIYIEFNSKNYSSLREVEENLDIIIEIYRASDQSIFFEFADLLVKYKEYIINSFITVEKTDSKGNKYSSRLSNGPIESINRKIKDLKRHARGFNSFSHLRNRFLFSERDDSTVRNTPLLTKELNRPKRRKRRK